MIKVRFNLGRGKNYMKWKISSKNSGVEYHYPKDVQLIMKNCILKNNKKLAKKIFDGQQKDVCAWILCESISINHHDIVKSPITSENAEQVLYNPKIAPFWRLNSSNLSYDNQKFSKIFSVENQLFT